jgi:glycosyltransferase involved in cell wall biosynthesis
MSGDIDPKPGAGLNKAIVKRVLLVYPKFNVIGGAELVALNMAAVLLARPDVAVTLLTLYHVDIEEMCHRTGIALPADRLRVQVAPCPSFVRSPGQAFTLAKTAFLNRTAKRLSGSYHLCIGANGEIDFGKRGFQYVHHPVFAPKEYLRQYKIMGRPTALDRFPSLGLAYRWVCFNISNGKTEGFRRNITAVNSHFIRLLVREVYGIESVVLRPVFGEERVAGAVRRWGERELQFVTIGRIAHDKDYLALLDLYDALQRAFPGAGFIILGRRDDADYETRIRSKVEMLGLNVQLIADATRDRVEEILRSSKFYIHAKQFEHFGISIVEAIEAGAIPLVHDSGGQVEIVSHPLLRYTDARSLVGNVERLLHDSDARASAQESLLHSIRDLRSVSFADGFDRLVDPLLSEAKD